jgi:hypothetical protein
MPRWYAGIDWSDDTHEVVVLDEAGRRVGEREVKHTVKGLQELNDFLQALTGSEHEKEVACIIETNHGLLISSRL